MDKIVKQAVFGDTVTKTLMGYPWAGVHSTEELLELEKNLKYMIEQKRFGYKYIEDYLNGIGYGVDLIRKAFERLTGVSALEYLDYSKYLNTPPSIPGISYGWGKSKDKKYDYYFIMSWVYGYTIFGQKGDLTRNEIDVFSSLDETRENCAKLVDELFYFDKVVDIDEFKNSKYTSDEPIYTRADQDAAVQQDKYEQLKKEVEEIEAQPFADLSKDETPQEFFTGNTGEKEEKTITENVQKITDYLQGKITNIKNFKIAIKMFKYQQKELEDRIERTPKIGDKKIEEFFSSTAIMPVLLDVEDMTLPTDVNKKSALMIFSVVDGNVTTSDKFKGEDNRMYALTEAGLDDYFKAERLGAGAVSKSPIDKVEDREEKEVERLKDREVENEEEEKKNEEQTEEEIEKTI